MNVPGVGPGRLRPPSGGLGPFHGGNDMPNPYGTVPDVLGGGNQPIHPIAGAFPPPQNDPRNNPVSASAPVTPDAPAAPNVNPYTGKPLGANEYVGVAGSEVDHPGMTRIPPPGWWDPSNANYERRNYYVGPHGEIVAREAGFQASEDDPYDTGRQDEINAEFEGRPGFTMVNLGEPGVTPWHRGEKRPEMAKYMPWAPGAASAGSQSAVVAGNDVAGLLGLPNPSTALSPGYEFDPSDPTASLLYALAQLGPRGRRPRGAV